MALVEKFMKRLKNMAIKPLATYNIDVGNNTVIVQKASGVSITQSGALILGGPNGMVIRAYNKDSWNEVWKVE